MFCIWSPGLYCIYGYIVYMVTWVTLYIWSPGLHCIYGHLGYDVYMVTWVTLYIWSCMPYFCPYLIPYGHGYMVLSHPSPSDRVLLL